MTGILPSMVLDPSFLGARPPGRPAGPGGGGKVGNLYAAKQRFITRGKRRRRNWYDFSLGLGEAACTYSSREISNFGTIEMAKINLI
jgi:hypothetical protein